MNSYCKYVVGLEKGNVHKVYHDREYGRWVRDDNKLFERLVLEINQAGLSWDTILKKQENFRKAFDNFEIKKIARYGVREKARLLKDAGIIRNRLKIEAVIHNAQVVLAFQKEFGSFGQWLQIQKGKTKPEWVKLFKQTFKFTGGEIVGEFLMSLDLLPGAHSRDCPHNAKNSYSKNFEI